MNNKSIVLDILLAANVLLFCYMLHFNVFPTHTVFSISPIAKPDPHSDSTKAQGLTVLARISEMPVQNSNFVQIKLFTYFKSLYQLHLMA